jgi:ATP-dependent Zn protease
MATENDTATAYHEAGHAVMALVLGRPVQRVSIEPNERRLGHCELKQGRFQPSEDALETSILILFAGPVAEARHTGEYCWDAGGQDLRDIRAMTRTRSTDLRRIERWERRLLDKAEHLLDRDGAWLAVERIAEELLRSTTISGRAARHLFEQAVAEADDER